MKQKWYIDKYLPNYRGYYLIKKVLFEKKTKFQKIQIFDLFDFGKSLVIDNIAQSSEKDEFIYHECLIHPALILQSARKKIEILVLGAGEGATLRELLKYKNVKKITTVDIDKEAVEIFKKFLPEMHQGSFNDKRVNLVIASAEDFLLNTDKKYDVIFSDISDFSYFNLGSTAKKSQINFYKLINQKLNKDGIFVMHTSDFSEVNYKDHFKLKKTLENNDLTEFGNILHQGWLYKQKLASKITNPVINDYYEKARKAGAIGGKILGSGGGGFLLFYCEEKNQDKVREALSNLKETSFNFEPQGSKIIYVG